MATPSTNTSTLTSLSKNALYAPLNTYLNGSKRDNLHSVGSTLREKSLYHFLETVSAEFHSPDSSLGIKNGESNGGMGISARQVEQKLSQRALTLIKGGIKTSLVKSTDELVDDTKGTANDSMGNRTSIETARKERSAKGLVRLHGSVSNRKRKRARKEMTSKTIVAQPTCPEILHGLHQIWNKYIQNLLVDSSNNSKEAISLLTSAELIGAIASVAKGRACRSYIGKIGFIVDITKNTWKLCVPKDGSTSTTEGINTCKEFKVIVVPKRGSTLLIKLPVKKGDPSDVETHVEITGKE